MAAELLCVGGPLDGKLARDCGMYLVYQCEDTHRNILEPLIPQLRPCLELEEIKALTGSSGHREPRFLAEDNERRMLLQKRYEKRRWANRRGGVIYIYVLDGMSDKEANQRVRKLVLG